MYIDPDPGYWCLTVINNNDWVNAHILSKDLCVCVAQMISPLMQKWMFVRKYPDEECMSYLVYLEGQKKINKKRVHV